MHFDTKNIYNKIEVGWDKSSFTSTKGEGRKQFYLC